MTPDNIVNLMLSLCENWNAVCFFAKEVLIQQRIMERVRTAEMDSSTCLIFTFSDVILDCGSGEDDIMEV